jgi:tRNA(adenine34) deaminase
MSDQDQRDIAMMHLALQQAELAREGGEVPVGAVVYRGPEVLAMAHNRRESDADPTAHAELLALRQAAGKVGSWRLDACSMAVTLEPCPMCAGALVNARIARLVYGAADPKMGAVDTLYQLCTETRFNHRLEVRSGLLANEARQLLQEFFQARRSDDKPPKPKPSDGNPSHQ